jgi:hypothetical protein
MGSMWYRASIVFLVFIVFYYCLFLNDIFYIQRLGLVWIYGMLDKIEN